MYKLKQEATSNKCKLLLIENIFLSARLSYLNTCMYITQNHLCRTTININEKLSVQRSKDACKIGIIPDQVSLQNKVSWNKYQWLFDNRQRQKTCEQGFSARQETNSLELCMQHARLFTKICAQTMFNLNTLASDNCDLKDIPLSSQQIFKHLIQNKDESNSHSPELRSHGQNSIPDTGVCAGSVGDITLGCSWSWSHCVSSSKCWVWILSPKRCGHLKQWPQNIQLIPHYSF